MNAKVSLGDKGVTHPAQAYLKLKNKFGATCQAKLRMIFRLPRSDSVAAETIVEDFIFLFNIVTYS